MPNKAELQQQLDTLIVKRERLRAEINGLDARAANGELTDGEAQRFERLVTGFDKLKAEEENLTSEIRRHALNGIAEVHRSGATRTEGGDGAAIGQNYGWPADGPSHRTGHVSDEARRTIDSAHRSGQLPDYAAERATDLVTSGSLHSQDIASQWAVATGAPAYRSAFAKLCSDPARGHMLWTPAEQNAYQAVQQVQSSMRAMSLTDANGGFMVPLTLDPAVMLTSDGSNNPLRRIARVVRTATDTWQGVSSAGVTAEWKAEAAQVADAAPTVGDEPIPVHFGDAFVPYSFEVGMDTPRFLDELQRLLLDGADQLMNTAYTTGTGTGQPTGIVTALTGTSSEINTTGTEAIVASDAFALQNALPPRFQSRAQWMMNLSIINTFRQFETTAGALKFPELTSGQLLGKPMNENSNMDGSINAAATANNYVAIYGDFSNFVIVDRIGTTLELIPNMMGANGRPTGQRGALLWFRTGSNVVVPQAFRMLDVPTTA